MNDTKTIKTQENKKVKSLAKKSKMAVIDAHELDNQIPRGLIVSMQGKPFVLKAGLEWKATALFGVGGWSLKTNIEKYEPANHYALVKAVVEANGNSYEDYGEASPENVPNAMMHKYILHLAITRAGNRALRRATACGMTSLEEMDTPEVIQAVQMEPVKQLKKPATNGKVVGVNFTPASERQINFLYDKAQLAGGIFLDTLAGEGMLTEVQKLTIGECSKLIQAVQAKNENLFMDILGLDLDESSGDFDGPPVNADPF